MVARVLPPGITSSARWNSACDRAVELRRSDAAGVASNLLLIGGSGRR
jgi:hypothetical protein